MCSERVGGFDWFVVVDVVCCTDCVAVSGRCCERGEFAKDGKTVGASDKVRSQGLREVAVMAGSEKRETTEEGSSFWSPMTSTHSRGKNPTWGWGRFQYLFSNINLLS